MDFAPAKWSGLALIGLRLSAGLAGAGLPVALAQCAAVASIGPF